MGATDILRVRAEPFLEEGEEIVWIIKAGWGKHRLLGLWNYPPIGRNLIIASTNRNLVILEVGRYREEVPKNLLTRLPLTTRIGPIRGWRTIWLKGLSRVLGGYVFVFWEFRDEIHRAESGFA